MLSIFTLWLVATLNYVFFSRPVANIYLEPPKQVQFFVNEPDPETKEMLRRYFGWDDPAHIRYLKHLYTLFTFGTAPPYFGWSTQYNEFVAEGMAFRLPITLFLLGSALIGTMILGIPIGVFAASKRGTRKDVALVASSLFSWGLPTFFIQFLAIFFIGDILRDRYGIGLFKTTWGGIKINRTAAPLQYWGAALTQLALPIITLVVVGFASWAVRSRFFLVDVLTKDFVTTARAKGLSERTVLYKHGFKSILPQISTMISLSLPGIVTGSFITEYVFGIKGIGQYLIRAYQMAEMTVFILDPAVVQAVFFIFATLVILLNLVADIIYGVLDPRIRVGTRR